jgi:hypothetical protein
MIIPSSLPIPHYQGVPCQPDPVNVYLDLIDMSLFVAYSEIDDSGFQHRSAISIRRWYGIHGLSAPLRTSALCLPAQQSEDGFVLLLGPHRVFIGGKHGDETLRRSMPPSSADRLLSRLLKDEQFFHQVHITSFLTVNGSFMV